MVLDGQYEVQDAGSEKFQALVLEEKAMQPQLAQRRQSGTSPRSTLEAMEAVQLQLRAQKTQDSRAYCQLRLQIHQRRQPHL